MQAVFHSEPTINADIERIHVGDCARCEIEVTPELIDAFALLSGDNNLLHMDDTYAQQLGFPSRVAHGMLALAAVSRLIGTKLPGHGSLWMSQDLQFTQPVAAGTRLVAEGRVTQVSRAARVVILSTEVFEATTGIRVLRGTAKVRVPRALQENHELGLPSGTAHPAEAPRSQDSMS